MLVFRCLQRPLPARAFPRKLAARANLFARDAQPKRRTGLFRVGRLWGGGGDHGAGSFNPVGLTRAGLPASRCLPYRLQSHKRATGYRNPMIAIALAALALATFIHGWFLLRLVRIAREQGVAKPRTRLVLMGTAPKYYREILPRGLVWGYRGAAFMNVLTYLGLLIAL